MKKLCLLGALCATFLSIGANAVTIGPNGSGYGGYIYDLEVQGTTYDGGFAWTTSGNVNTPDPFPFISNQTAAEDAANQIAQALGDDGYTSVTKSWLDYFFVPFEDPRVEDSVQAYKGEYSSSNGGEWLVTLETTHGLLGTANSWAYLTAVPVPAAIWLFGSGLLGLIGIARFKKVA